MRAVLPLCLALAACGVQETARSPYVAAPLEPVRVVAADPAGGPFGDAVADALAARGVAVVPAPQVREAMAAAGVPMSALSRLNGLAFLQGRGADARMTVSVAAEAAAAPPRAAAAPPRAAAALRRVPDGAILAEARWEPFLGGWTGRQFDRAAARGDGTAAAALAAELAAALAR
jgi:hypothetical protein